MFSGSVKGNSKRTTTNKSLNLMDIPIKDTDLSHLPKFPFDTL